MNKAILQDKIHRFLDGQNADELKLLFEELHPTVTAEAMEAFLPADIAGVLIYFSIATWYLGIGA